MGVVVVGGAVVIGGGGSTGASTNIAVPPCIQIMFCDDIIAPPIG